MNKTCGIIWDYYDSFVIIKAVDASGKILESASYNIPCLDPQLIQDAYRKVYDFTLQEGYTIDMGIVESEAS